MSESEKKTRDWSELRVGEVLGDPEPGEDLTMHGLPLQFDDKPPRALVEQIRRSHAK